MANHYLDFERPLLDLATRIEDLAAMQAAGKDIPEKNIPAEIKRLEVKRAKVTRLLYRQLSPWQKVQVARHPERPHPLDYILKLITDFMPLSGDRQFGDDPAMIAGLGRFNGQPVAVLGINKGKTTQERLACQFGMPKPEGYRKAQRIMHLANKFKLPILTFVDTPGAFPGVEAEARGQGEAIASSIEVSLTMDVPIIATITGEGGSGGALALATADKVIMLEHSIYSVISPEGCAAILMKEANKNTIPQAAEGLKLTAQDLAKFGLIDEVIKEPVGGAHRDADLTIERAGKTIAAALKDLKTDKHARRQKFLGLTG